MSIIYIYIYMYMRNVLQRYLLSFDIKIKTEKKANFCQEWDSNPCPFGPVPETGALDQLGHLDLSFKKTKNLYNYLISYHPLLIYNHHIM